jgi:glycosyltransferase involved in cell wall biosynthesis
MLLSIAMIVKNEEKNLRKCLEALAPLRQAVDSELIITDTGSTDSTVEIAKEFADKILHFEWCGDFAKARNTGLRAAKGQWFMFLDADEVFKNTNGIISFFCSGEYKKYKSAAYIVRNYSTADGEFYADTSAARLCRLTKETRFVNPIHESLYPLYEPVKYIRDIADHYGYVGEANTPAIMQKYKRNAEILLKEYEEGSVRNLIYAQLCDAFTMADDLGKALEYCEKGLEKLSRSSLPYFALMVKGIRILDILERYSDVMKMSERYFSERKNVTGLDLDAEFYTAKAYYKTACYEKAAEHYKNYAELYKKIKDYPDKYISVTFEIITSDSLSFRTAMDNAAECCIKLNDFTQGREYLSLSPMKSWLKYTDYIKTRMEKEFCIMRGMSDYSAAVELLAGTDSKNSSTFYVQAKKELLYKPDKDNAQKLLAVLLDSNAEPVFAELLKCCENYYNSTLTAEAVKLAAEKITDWKQLYCDIIFFAVKLNLPCGFLSDRINAFELAQNCQLCAYSFPDLYGQIFSYADECEKPTDFKQALFMYMLCEAAFSYGRLEASKNYALLEKMAEYAAVYLDTIYNSILSAENIVAFPDTAKEMFWCREAVQAEKRGDEAGYIRSLKEMLKAAPQCRYAVGQLGEEFRKKAIDSKKQPALTEFEMLALTVKNNIKALALAGNYTQAESVLASYEQLNPKDKEIAELRKMIGKS